MRGIRTRRWAVLIVAAVGCSDGTNVAEEDAASAQARTECKLLFDCDCEPPYENEQACVDEREQQYEQIYAPLRNTDLVWDGRCLGKVIDELEGQGCSPAPLLPPNEIPDDFECQRPCLPYHGEAKLGDPCVVFTGAGFSNCDQGLICDGERCIDPCELFEGGLAAGEACRDGFEVLGDCADGLVCDAGATDVCISLPGPGAPCPQGQCAEGSYCETVIDQSTCVAKAANGQSCTNDEGCMTDHCLNGTCSEVPGAGQTCVGRCTEGLLCSNSVCVAPASAGQACTDVPCELGLICAEGVCQVGPGGGQACVDGQCDSDFACEGGVCVPRPAQVCGSL